MTERWRMLWSRWDRDGQDGLAGAPASARFGARAIWAVFVVFPVANAIGEPGTAGERALTIAAAVAFVVAYVLIIITWRVGPRAAPHTIACQVVMMVLAGLLTIFSDPGWGFLFCYCGAAGAMMIGGGAGFWTLALCAVLAGVLPALAGASGGAIVSFAASTAGIGLLMLLMRNLRLRNEELSTARAELARMAVAEERERFARDLHDLLGHTLSVITLKAELAGRLLPARPEAAAAEVGDLERVARAALSEVREAVSGYRRPTLERELAGARMALAAARIEVAIDEDRAPLLSADAEAVLAWGVREGATNVIRHSRARRCTIIVAGDGQTAGVEISDDGVGEGPRSRAGGTVIDGAGGGPAGLAGNGLAGLAERARAVGGRVSAGAGEAGGFVLRVEVPCAGAPSSAPIESAAEATTRQHS